MARVFREVRSRDVRPALALVAASGAAVLASFAWRAAAWLFAILLALAVIRSLALVVAARSAGRDPEGPGHDTGTKPSGG